MFVIRSWLIIGKYSQTINRPLLDANGIGAMLLLAEPVSHQGIESLYLQVEDGVALPVPLLKQGVEFILNQKAQNKRVLVACGAGISRSVTFSIAALTESDGGSIFDTYRAIKEVHPDAMPHPELWMSLAEYYGVRKSFNELWQEIRK